MSGRPCESRLPWSALIRYWLGELPPAKEANVEEHYLGCAECSQQIEQLATFARSVQSAARTSGVDMVINDEFVHRLTQDGFRVREYRAPRGGSVKCTATPGDDFVVGYLEVPLAGIQRVDVLTIDGDGNTQSRQEDVPFVAASGSVVICPSIAKLRAQSFTLRLRLLAVDEHGDHSLGDYTFNHRLYTPRNPPQ